MQQKITALDDVVLVQHRQLVALNANNTRNLAAPVRERGRERERETEPKKQREKERKAPKELARERERRTQGCRGRSPGRAAQTAPQSPGWR
jgi:hypothetical protein